MLNGWVKLYRKLEDSPVWHDVNACRVLIWLLMKVDRETGKLKLGRKWASEACDLKEITFYKALKRLESKYQIITLVTRKVTIKFTEVSVNKWHLYQPGNNDDNNPVTIREQSDNNPVTHNKNRERRIEKGEGIFLLTKNQKSKLSEQFPGIDIETEFQKARDHLKAEGIIKKDYVAWFRNWLRRSSDYAPPLKDSKPGDKNDRLLRVSLKMAEKQRLAG